ncbi:hypothetical protein I6N95_04060 [Vagococcus sp. BWB3-3]|uniref:Uncharacterized protein n=1 Tax=Vagococcus allomyrinae TaxID=2794353 RepID=A0A940SUL4_9ENTE|nr:hypothetical protein [Vagococcus allomyrinae]MBP1040181.1 hypothetical protein [Vagococcus allomyrinae]
MGEDCVSKGVGKCRHCRNSVAIHQGQQITLEKNTIASLTIVEIIDLRDS